MNIQTIIFIQNCLIWLSQSSFWTFWLIRFFIRIFWFWFLLFFRIWTRISIPGLLITNIAFYSGLRSPKHRFPWLEQDYFLIKHYVKLTRRFYFFLCYFGLLWFLFFLLGSRFSFLALAIRAHHLFDSHLFLFGRFELFGKVE